MFIRKANTPPLIGLRQRILYLAVASALCGSGVFSANASAAGLVTTTGVQALMAAETVTGAAQQTVVSVGPLTNQDGSVQQTGLESGVDSTSLAVVPINAALGTTVYSSNQDAENAVSGYVKNYLTQIGNAVQGAMKSSGTAVQLGMFTYIQNVQIANPTGGSPTKAQVYATVQMPFNGQPQFLGANVNNNTLYLMYAIYQQSKDAAYLPAGWTVPNAGETQWELAQITIEGSTMQAAPVAVDGSVWHTIQDNGAYDGAETVVNGVEKINYAPGIASWIKNQITPLMNQYNANLSVAMYGEQVKVSRNSAGQPLTAISVNSRVLTQHPGACGQAGSAGSFATSGDYGYLLTENESQYIVQPNGSYSDGGQNQENTISPTQNYSESAAVPAGASASTYEEDLIFPIAPDQGQVVNYTAGSPLPTSDYTYMAPLTVNNGGAGSSGGNYEQITVNGNTYCGNFSQLTGYQGGFSGPTMYENGVQLPSGDFHISISLRHVSYGHDYYHNNGVNVVGVGIAGEYVGWAGQQAGPAFDVSYCDNSMYCGGEICVPGACYSVAQENPGYSPGR